MSKLSITDRVPDELSPFDAPKVRLSGQVASRCVISSRDFTLSLWRHQLAAGAALTVDGPAEDHVFYVLTGDMRVGATPIEPGGAASIGRGATAELSGGAAGATLLHFIGHAATRPDRAGGCVHLMRTGWTERSADRRHTLYFDSGCPTCAVWLHRSGSGSGRFAAPHHHTEDEIICVVEGDLDLGTRRIAAGGAAAVGREMVYSFTSGEAGLTFVNFRQADPFFVPKDASQKAPESERKLLRARLESARAEREAGSAAG
ncbi:hypothetical protein [Phenylobacterium sp. J367]|uniref:hypothetical protein n=1 Tax=Phenylobacterium sp. J367 TaxID=2898435 RepID=UPI002151D60F|nr:hypothetical protein [Phenylobacterium sp. J367]MCR5879550.1 hypothetical protein [Phenylobacterium sp. J367]